MSAQSTLKNNQERSQPSPTSAQTPLTAANLAAHQGNDPVAQQDSSNMQRWLSYTEDTLFQARKAREARDWDQLKEKDDLAAAIEKAS